MSRRGIVRAEEAGQWELDGRPVACLLRRSSARRTLAMRVDGQGRVVVNLPLRAPVADVEAFLARHQGWLRDQLRRARAVFVWRVGRGLPFLGGSLGLTLASGTDGVRRDGDRLLVPDLDTASVSVPAWYRAEARVRLGGRLCCPTPAPAGAACPPRGWSA
jgi:predicted metal-dependent hydrolase